MNNHIKNISVSSVLAASAIVLGACGGGGGSGGGSGNGGDTPNPRITSFAVTGTDGNVTEMGDTRAAAVMISPFQNGGELAIDFSTNQGDNIHRLEIHISPDARYSDDDERVIGTNCSNGIGEQACTDIAHWECVKTSSPDYIDCDKVHETGESPFTSHFNNHGRPSNAWLVMTACTYGLVDGNFDEICDEEAVPVIIE